MLFTRILLKHYYMLYRLWYVAVGCFCWWSVMLFDLVEDIICMQLLITATTVGF